MAKMTEAQTLADICNLAIVRNGGETIETLADSDKSDNAILCRRVIQPVLSICLGRHEWNFAGKFAGLGAARDDADQEQADYEFVFNLPDDCLQVVAQIAEGNHRKKFPYIVKGLQLFTNFLSNNAGDSAYIDYISIGATGRFSGGFTEYFALKLAMTIAPKLMGISEESAIHIQTMERELRLRVLPEAIGRNQAEGDEQGGNDEGESTWLKSR